MLSELASVIIPDNFPVVPANEIFNRKVERMNKDYENCKSNLRRSDGGYNRNNYRITNGNRIDIFPWIIARK